MSTIKKPTLYLALFLIVASGLLAYSAAWHDVIIVDEDPHIAAALYVIDHMFFALYIAMSTYFHKIADPADLASSAGVSFTINHIAAVVIPALLGYVWIQSNSLVFFIGAGFALCSLLLAQNIPSNPAPGNEVVVGGSEGAKPARV